MAVEGDDLAFVGGAWCWHWGPTNEVMNLMSSMVFSSWTDVSGAGASCRKKWKSLGVSPSLTSSPLLQGMRHDAENRCLQHSQGWL